MKNGLFDQLTVGHFAEKFFDRKETNKNSVQLDLRNNIYLVQEALQGLRQVLSSPKEPSLYVKIHTFNYF